jgi:hypothetical protein
VLEGYLFQQRGVCIAAIDESFDVVDPLLPNDELSRE